MDPEKSAEPMDGDWKLCICFVTMSFLVNTFFLVVLVTNRWRLVAYVCSYVILLVSNEAANSTPTSMIASWRSLSAQRLAPSFRSQVQPQVQLHSSASLWASTTGDGSLRPRGCDMGPCVKA
jgi:hypothetical protein